MAVETTLVTVEDYLQLPPTKTGHYELHHGEIVHITAPKWGHHRIQDRIQMILKRLSEDRAVVQMEMAFRPAPDYEVWEADVGLVSLDRENSVGDDEYLSGAPDLVVEVLSPSNTVDEIDDKMTICMTNGCVSFWIVNPKRKIISVREGSITRHYGVSETISCSLFQGDLVVQDVF
jgi:Uma2 family endonuclease